MSGDPPIRASLEGRPLAEQYLARAVRLLPAEVVQHPGSREFRAALRDLSEKTGLLPTRSETRRALRQLEARGVWPGEFER